MIVAYGSPHGILRNDKPIKLRKKAGATELEANDFPHWQRSFVRFHAYQRAESRDGPFYLCLLV